MRALNEEESSLEIPMTPLIDVVFLLLIFFLVATSFTRKEIDQKVKLPKAEGGSKQEQIPKNLVINLRKDGTVIVNGRVYKEAALRTKVGEWHGKNPECRVVLRGDEGVLYGRIARVMGICRAVGVTDIDLPVEDVQG